MRRNPTHFDPFVALYSDSDNYMETNLPSITPWCMSSRKISRSFISICLRVESPPYNILWALSRERDLPSPHIDGRGKGLFDLLLVLTLLSLPLKWNSSPNMSQLRSFHLKGLLGRDAITLTILTRVGSQKNGSFKFFSVSWFHSERNLCTLAHARCPCWVLSV